MGGEQRTFADGAWGCTHAYDEARKWSAKQPDCMPAKKPPGGSAETVVKSACVFSDARACCRSKDVRTVTLAVAALLDVEGGAKICSSCPLQL